MKKVDKIIEWLKVAKETLPDGYKFSATTVATSTKTSPKHASTVLRELWKMGALKRGMWEGRHRYSIARAINEVDRMKLAVLWQPEKRAGEVNVRTEEKKVPIEEVIRAYVAAVDGAENIHNKVVEGNDLIIINLLRSIDEGVRYLVRKASSVSEPTPKKHWWQKWIK